MNNNDICMGKIQFLPIEEAAAYLHEKTSCKTLTEENKHAGWLIENGNRIQTNAEQFRKVIDKLTH